ncbi:MAG TPA: hypothetical protein VFO45_03335 [Sphingomicrobium sp.]|nr:hypothetical protein [Sphingomicrobium sp.]
MQIDENKRPRTALKTYFAKNAIPTEGQFSQLIESSINQRDDGVVKNPGDPLSIEATGDDVGLKRAVNFYMSFADADPAWTISLRPRRKPADPNTGRAGWSIGDAAGNSRLCIDASNGNVGIGTVAPVEPLEVTGRVRAGAAGIGPWPANEKYSYFGSSALDQSIPGNYALLQANSSKGQTLVNSPTQVSLRIGNSDRLVVDNDGVTVHGSLTIAGSDLYFTETSHNHTGIGNAIGYAAIENASNYGALMILGRSVPTAGGFTRVVKLWDQLEVNGLLNARGDISILDKHAFRGTDPWLRLNQDGAFSLGTHTPGLFAPGSLNVGGYNGWANPGHGNAYITGDLLVAGKIGSMNYGPGPRTSGWAGGMRTWDLEVEASAWCRLGWASGARDLAENYFSDEALEVGDVVGLTDAGDGIAATDQPHDRRVIGIVSKQPGVLLGSLHQPDEEDIAEEGRTAHPIALLGCTPCKVTDEGGPIRRGDLLTPASTPGHAMRAAADDHAAGTILGKALEPHAEGAGIIEVFVMLR